MRFHVFFSLVNVTFSLYAPANLNRAQTVICAKLYLVCVFLFCCSLDVVIFEEKQWRVVYGQIVVGKNYMCSKFNKLIEDYAWDWTIIPKRKLIISNKRNFWAYSDYIQSTTRMCLTDVRREILFIPKKMDLEGELRDQMMMTAMMSLRFDHSWAKLLVRLTMCSWNCLFGVGHTYHLFLSY